VLTREHVLWIIILLIAAATRAVGLELPLSDGEARVALEALGASRGDSAVLFNPLHGLLQSVLFALFGDGASVSRIIGAFAGAALAALPLLARSRIGRARALTLGLLLAISPTLMFVSRQATGDMLTWTLAAAVIWLPVSRPIWRACAFGLLLACGIDAPIPVLTALAVRFLDGADTTAARAGLDFSALRKPALIGALALAAGASGLLFRPAGLSDVLAGYAAWATGWSNASGFSSGRLLTGFAVNELGLIILALIGAALTLLTRGAQDRPAAGIGWLAAGLLTLAVYPGRDPSTVLPLTIGAAWFASIALGRLCEALLTRASWMDWAASGIAFVAFQFASVGVRQYAQQAQDNFLLPLPVAFMLCSALVLAAYLNGDARIGLRGVGAGLAGTLLIYTVGVGVQLTQLRWNNPAEPYVLNAPSAALDALAATVRATSTRATGVPNAVPIVVDPTAPPALRWALREQRNTRAGSEFGALNAAVLPMAAKPTSERGFIGSPFEVLRSSEIDLSCARSAEGRLDCTRLAKWFAFRTIDPATQIDAQRWTLWLSDSLAAQSGGR
jgi:hypothetical protein